MSLEKITQQEIYDASMERLANYPTAASRYGIGGLNDRQLKARYDKLAKLAIAKLNVLIDSINSPAESADALLKLLITPIPGETEGVYLTLCDVLEDVISGDLATYLALKGLAKGNLQAELEELERLISDTTKSLALGETAGTAFRGDHGKLAYEHSQSSGNPHGTTAEDIGIFIEQTTGNSENAVMSQKAATANFALKSDITTMWNEVNGINTAIGTGVIE